MKTVEEADVDGWFEFDGRIFRRVFLGATLKIVGSSCDFCRDVNKKTLSGWDYCATQAFKDALAASDGSKRKEFYLCREQDEVWVVDYEARG